MAALQIDRAARRAQRHHVDVRRVAIEHALAGRVAGRAGGERRIAAGAAREPGVDGAELHVDGHRAPMLRHPAPHVRGGEVAGALDGRAVEVLEAEQPLIAALRAQVHHAPEQAPGG
jgi:hypothetical protein